jgi:VIT1/CCC1 family predicted Fe2+/Mn2+ transporter
MRWANHMEKRSGLFSQVELQKDWYRDVAREIGSIEEGLGQRDQRRYKLSLLLRLAQRVTNFSADCSECQHFQGPISRLTEDLKYLHQMTPRKYKGYLTTIKSITRHLKQKHGLIEGRQYTRRFVSLSAAFGVLLIILGYVLLNFGITLLVLSVTLPALVVRVIFSYAFGWFLDRRAKKEDRLI